MTARISHLSIDCTDAYGLSQWWKQVLGFVDVEGDPNEPGDEQCMIRSPTTGEHILFLEVPGFDTATPKRIHLDLRPVERTRDEELEVLLVLGGDRGGRSPRARSASCCARAPDAVRALPAGGCALAPTAQGGWHGHGMARYRWRTALRRHLPWLLVDLGVARQGRRDCGAHEWYRSSDAEERCYHCTVGLRRR